VEDSNVKVWMAVPTSLVLIGLYIGLRFLPDRSTPIERRTAAVVAAPTLNLGVVWPEKVYGSDFVQGVMLAAEEVNARGGIRGKQIRLRLELGPNGARRELALATRFAKDPSVFAVIGHPSPESAISASVTYDAHQLPFIAPRSTSVRLGRHGFGLLFMLMPDDAKMGEALAQFVKAQGYRSAGVLSVRSPYSQSLTQGFLRQALESGLSLAFSRSVPPELVDFKPIIAEAMNSNMDVAMVAAQGAQGGIIVEQIRKMGFHVPIIGGYDLYTGSFLEAAKGAGEGVVVMSPFDDATIESRGGEFLERYRLRFGSDPDSWSAQGYDIINLLASTIERCDCFDIELFASTLRYTSRWEGITGDFSFQKNGSVADTTVFIKKVINGRFRDMPSRGAIEEKVTP
jgi:branched-chain amino acid transport system substrate-binding protein